MKAFLKIRLLSDATFGRGDGVVGLVDEEVEYDSETGLPFIRGRTLKGLLVEECANILFALTLQSSAQHDQFEQAAQFLFGQPGSTLVDDGALHFGAATLPEKLRIAILQDIRSDRIAPPEVLELLTTIRRQTAIDVSTGAPDEGSLRSMRVVLRDTPFYAPLRFAQIPGDAAKGLFAACVLTLRRGGTGRNRGRGRLCARLLDEKQTDITKEWFELFRQLIGGSPL